jgi:hypothetical protein
LLLRWGAYDPIAASHGFLVGSQQYLESRHRAASACRDEISEAAFRGGVTLVGVTFQSNDLSGA